MNVKIYQNFHTAISECQAHLRRSGCPVYTESWQGIKKGVEFIEALNVSFSVVIPQKLTDVQEQTKCSMPWCDVHFAERVSGKPLNPGESYKIWPWYKDGTFKKDDKFSHTYMERFWPKEAGGDFEWGRGELSGIRYNFGDLNTLMEVLKSEPYTRQAFLPIWFPEDGEAILAGQRVPCTLGYHIIRRGHQLHMVYYIRSCDFFRHFRDDIYLAIKLLHHILKTLQANDVEKWFDITMGTFTMHITSLHVFQQEYNRLKD